MSTTWDAIIVGGGHNGLACAAYLAKAGLKVLVLERRHIIGGAAVTRELHDGWKYSNCSYVCSMMRQALHRDLDLSRHGLLLVPYLGTVAFGEIARSASGRFFRSTSRTSGSSPATANAIRYVGAEVVFADVDPDTGLMTADIDPIDRPFLTGERTPHPDPDARRAVWISLASGIVTAVVLVTTLVALRMV